jgi:hypothetical protein
MSRGAGAGAGAVPQHAAGPLARGVAGGRASAGMPGPPGSSCGPTPAGTRSGCASNCTATSAGLGRSRPTSSANESGSRPGKKPEPGPEVPSASRTSTPRRSAWAPWAWTHCVRPCPAASAPASAPALPRRRAGSATAASPGGRVPGGRRAAGCSRAGRGSAGRVQGWWSRRPRSRTRWPGGRRRLGPSAPHWAIREARASLSSEQPHGAGLRGPGRDRPRRCIRARGGA